MEAIFESYGLPGWLGWGTMGAESTYGDATTGHHFGLIYPEYSGVAPNEDWKHNAAISAKLYRQLTDQYGSVAAAVPHYSGNSYTIAHVKRLGKPQSAGASQGSEAVNVNLLEEFFGNLLGPAGKPLLEGADALGVEPDDALEAVPNSLGIDLGPFQQAAAAVVAFFSMLVDINFWIRVGQAVGAFILIYLGLKAIL